MYKTAIKNEKKKSKQKFDLGTRISRRPRDDDRKNGGMQYQQERCDLIGMIESFERRDKNGGEWVYYVRYFADHDAEQMTEREISEHLKMTKKPLAYVRYYFSSVEEDAAEAYWLDINWNHFLEDLEYCPDFARCRFGISDNTPLHFVLLVRDVPVNVVERLLQICPEAVDDREPDHGWNTLGWVTTLRYSVDDLCPQILRILLCRDSKMAVESCGTNESVIGTFRGPPDSPISEQMKAILKYSPEAVSYILAKNYNGEEPFDDDLVLAAFNAAKEHERNGSNVFLLRVEVDPDDPSFTLLHVLFESLDETKTEVFEEYLKGYVEASCEHKGDCSLPFQGNVEVSSVTDCVLYQWSHWSEDGNGDEYYVTATKAWEKYKRYYSEDLKKPKKDGSSPLYTAIQKGVEWDGKVSILKDIIEADHDVLNGNRPQCGLQPFMVAAMSDSDVNTVFELLRRSSSAIRENNSNQPTTKRCAPKKSSSKSKKKKHK